MSGTTNERSIANRTDSRKNHQIRFVISSQGGTVTDMKTLKAGETAPLADGDRLIIISDRSTNYAIRWENGALLGADQINNSHPKFPEMTVASYRLASASSHDVDSELEMSGSDKDEDDPDDGDGPGGVIIVTEPDEPQP
ncbi:MAG: hypothetical protein R6U28_06305 [Cyclonatronaceae bacterium]